MFCVAVALERGLKWKKYTMGRNRYYIKKFYDTGKGFPRDGVNSLKSIS